jgi:hypothetical protein
MHEENFATLPSPSQENCSKINWHRVSKPSVAPNSIRITIKKGWVIAASRLLVSISIFLRQEPKQLKLSHLKVSGELPDFQNATNTKLIK